MVNGKYVELDFVIVILEWISPDHIHDMGMVIRYVKESYNRNSENYESINPLAKKDSELSSMIDFIKVQTVIF